MNPATLKKDHPEIYIDGPTDEMIAKWDAEWSARRIPWTGEWPGVAECREFGWYAKRAPIGWHPCDQRDDGATEDLNRLYSGEARWDRDTQRWVKNTMSRITLEKFVIEEKARVDRFAVWWREQREKNGATDWPLRLPEGEWDEQLRIYADETST